MHSGIWLQPAVDNKGLVENPHVGELGHNIADEIIDAEQRLPAVAKVLVLPALDGLGKRRVLAHVLGLVWRAEVPVDRHRRRMVLKRVLVPRRRFFAEKKEVCVEVIARIGAGT